jgi:hypothetical protein
MGLLDDLRQQAEQRRSAGKDAESEQARHDEIYRTQIKPKIEALYDYLQELVQHLNYLDMEIPVRYRFYGSTKSEGFKQKNYSLRIDAQETTMALTLHCEAVADRPVSIPAKTEAVAAAIGKELKQHGLQAVVHEASSKDAGKAFYVKVEPVIPIFFDFSADRGREAIVLHLENYAELGVMSDLFTVEKLDDLWFDHVGALIMRKSDRLIRRSITVEERRKIQNRLASDQEERRKDDPNRMFGSGWRGLFSRKP